MRKTHNCNKSCWQKIRTRNLKRENTSNAHWFSFGPLWPFILYWEQQITQTPINNNSGSCSNESNTTNQPPEFIMRQSTPHLGWCSLFSSITSLYSHHEIKYSLWWVKLLIWLLFKWRVWSISAINMLLYNIVIHYISLSPSLLHILTLNFAISASLDHSRTYLGLFLFILIYLSHLTQTSCINYFSLARGTR